jgi:ankyrin repeat protein
MSCITFDIIPIYINPNLPRSDVNFPRSDNAFDRYNQDSDGDDMVIESYLLPNGMEDDLDTSVPNTTSNIAKRRHNTRLIVAALEDNYDRIKNLLERHHIDPNYQNSDGITALHCAAGNNNDKIVKLLLEYHANPNIEDNDGDTPLHLAVDQNGFVVAQILINYGADVSSENNLMKTPVDYAHNDEMEAIFSK